MKEKDVTRLKLLVALFFLVALLSGCSATSALTGLIGIKPEITAQAGAENTRQTVGLNNKVDTSSDQDTSFKDSSVGQVDTSSRKKVSANSISAQTITAERIEIRNSPETNWYAVAGVAAAILILILGLYYFFGRTKK